MSNVIPLEKPAPVFDNRDAQRYAAQHGLQLMEEILVRLRDIQSDQDAERFGLWMRATLCQQAYALTERALEMGANWPEARAMAITMSRVCKLAVEREPGFPGWPEADRQVLDEVLGPKTIEGAA